MKEQIKELRVKIDGLSQLVKELKPLNPADYAETEEAKFEAEMWYKPFNSEEVNKAYDNLILAKAWLGKLLGELGTENPYGSGYKTVEDIVPTQDVNKEIKFPYNHHLDESLPVKEKGKELSHIEKVDWLRQQIESIISNIPTATVYNATREWNIARTNTYNHLCEARFWLGFELQRIKESN